MINVLHLSRNFHPTIGGTENFVAGLAASVAPLGVRSAVVCSTRRAFGAGPEPSVLVLRTPTIGPERLQLVRHVSTELRACVTWADVLHFHDLRFGLDILGRLGAARRKPRVLSTHGLIFHTNDDQRVKRIAWRSMFLPALRSFDAILADSRADFSRVATLPRARLVENPVDIAQFLPVAGAPLNPHGPLLYFGRVAPNKGIERLAGVLRADSASRLVITGRGDPHYTGTLERELADFAVEFVGELDDLALIDQLRACRAIVLPSRAEGFGLTLVEAMATGRPVVAANIPPYREIASGTAVELVDFDDPMQVVERVRAAIAAVDRSSSVERARSYSWDQRAPQFADLYRALAETGHHPRA